MRINKYLADCGVASRRACDKLIENGEVEINGKIATLGQEVKFSDIISVSGNVVNAVKKHDYYMLNKPKGYVTTVSDDKNRKIVMDLLPKTASRLFPVGRLDYDTEGLLILTNDGDLTFRLTHPKNEIPKTYLVKVEGEITEIALSKLRAGVSVDGEFTKKCNVRIGEVAKGETKIYITITEGRNRQIRKMFEAVGKEVVFLKRVKIGDLTLRGLDRGKCRKLTASEVDYLKNL